MKQEFEQGRRPGEVLLYADQSDLHLQPLIGNNWQMKGTQNRVPDARQNRKAYCFGAIDFMTGRVTCSLKDRKRSGEFVEFLEALRKKYRGLLVHLVLDNFSIHTSREVKQYLERRPGVFEFHFLPTYSPWLNPMETVWSQMKAAVCRNKFHGTIENLKQAVRRYFLHCAVHEGALRAAA